MLAVYAGNDFLAEPFGRWIPPAIAERPLPSLLADVAPRSTWFIVNRLGLSEFGRGNKPIEGEFEQLNGWLDLPPDQRLDRIVDHMKHYYFPQLDEAAIREILSRGGGRFWTAFDKRRKDRERWPAGCCRA